MLGIEAKLTSAVTDTDVTHLRWLRERLGDACTDLVVPST